MSDVRESDKANLNFLAAFKSGQKRDIDRIDQLLLTCDDPAIKADLVQRRADHLELIRTATVGEEKIRTDRRERNRRKVNPFAHARDIVIRNCRGRSHLDICRALDTILGIDGFVRQEYFPEKWPDYGVKTFVEAYYHPECRKLVAPMISKARVA